MSRNMNYLTRSVLGLMIVGTLAACDQSPTAPIPSDVAVFDGTDAAGRTSTSGRTSTGRPTTAVPGRPVSVDSLRPCRNGDQPTLTPEQIEAIRALWAAYHAEVNPLLRYINEVEMQAREAKANGASDERVAQILAQADSAKRQVAKATERLRDAINAILTEGQRRNHCLVAVPVTP